MQIKTHRHPLEMLQAANLIENEEDRAAYIRHNMNAAVAKILIAIHNPNIEFFCPRKIEYKQPHKNLPESSLAKEIKRLYLFTHPVSLDEKTLIRLLTRTLESLSNEESDFFLNNILAKKNPFKNIGKVFVRHQFPKLLEYTTMPR